MRKNCELVVCDQCGMTATVPVGELPDGWVRWKMLIGTPDPQPCDACSPVCAVVFCCLLLKLPMPDTLIGVEQSAALKSLLGAPKGA